MGHLVEGITLVGLTGGIGSGKSTVAAMLADEGFAIFDLDAIAHEVLKNDEEIKRMVISLFGTGCIDPITDRPSRKAIGSLVFANPGLRRAYDAAFHPRILGVLIERLTAFRDSGGTIAVIDVPLLFEISMDTLVHETIVVYAPLQARRTRIAARNGLDDAEIERRIASQMDLDEKCRRADIVIDNGSTVEHTLEQVRTIARTLGKSLPPADRIAFQARSV
jgi:dephospho-CoA kinase